MAINNEQRDFRDRYKLLQAQQLYELREQYGRIL